MNQRIQRISQAEQVVGSVDTSEFPVSLAATIGFFISLGWEQVSWVWVFSLMLGGIVAAPIAAWLVRIVPSHLLDVLDGNAFFQTFHEAVKIQSVRVEKTGVAPAVIVGIGYPIEGAFSGEERCYDFTPNVISKDAALKPDGKPWPKTGGAYHFFTFIEEELK
ncbi:hypothetical protein ACT453_16065, partial [Bacillus sp. D-CC]